jgi:hypothetical protein
MEEGQTPTQEERGERKTKIPRTREILPGCSREQRCLASYGHVGSHVQAFVIQKFLARWTVREDFLPRKAVPRRTRLSIWAGGRPLSADLEDANARQASIQRLEIRKWGSA